MDLKNKLFETHKFYNLSRYLFLNIECNYNNIVKKTGITLPQLRVLWIIRIFNGISLGEIAKIGCWSPPTVTKMLKLLMDKKFVVRESTINKKLYTLNLTESGYGIIKINGIKKYDEFPLLSLLPTINNYDLNFIIKIFKKITVNSNNVFIFEYIEEINRLQLKIDLDDFNHEDKIILKQLICFYNLLRTFILTIESNHRKLLTDFKLTYPQLRVLWIIDAFPGITSSRLSKLAYLAPSTVNVIVKNLYGKDIIYKEKSQLKNSLFLYISISGEELLVKEFNENQKSFLIYKDIEFLTTHEISKLNRLMYEMNITLKNDMVSAYIKETFNVIEKRII